DVHAIVRVLEGSSSPCVGSDVVVEEDVPLRIVDLHSVLLVARDDVALPRAITYQSGGTRTLEQDSVCLVSQILAGLGVRPDIVPDDPVVGTAAARDPDSVALI